jgi:hypothetical protein
MTWRALSISPHHREEQARHVLLVANRAHLRQNLLEARQGVAAVLKTMYGLLLLFRLIQFH